MVSEIKNSQRVLPVCSAVVKDGYKYLLVQSGEKNYIGKWGLAGGKIDFSETPSKAIEREVHEEAGLLIYNIGLFGIYCSMPLDAIWVINHAYRCDFLGQAKKSDGKEILNIGWFTYEELVGMAKNNELRTMDVLRVISDSRRGMIISGLDQVVNGVLDLGDVVNV